ncbi:UDP-galactose-4-epimerase [Paenibacillus swuensis]|uniref:UDP-glucose 4-epimerase n=1 Tax=Paenibacillus swuensis TaxID=1178515 RepID=A0A172TGT1_9BACL|nr:UDP-galactose-4-epimerase [Paenibacillus swuensis]
MAILVTGGAGYIGSHTCIELLAEGHEVVVTDNLVNSKYEAIRRVEEISGHKVTFYGTDLLDRDGLQAVFEKHEVEAVIHFAGLKAVGESVHRPLSYYRNNVMGTLILCETMQKYGVRNLVFSSSATVYGLPERVPITESFPLSATNPYGRTKLMLEEMLQDLANSDSRWSIALLRYFNPIGAHPSGRLGEDPNGIPNNLVPYITQVASGKLASLKVFGNDYSTPDGTGIRDYIHVSDLARGHLSALKQVLGSFGIDAYNLGTGQGYSVLEMIRVFEQVTGRDIAYTIEARRPGDIAVCYANPNKARTELGWQAEKGIQEMAADAWRWQHSNPAGYPVHVDPRRLLGTGSNGDFSHLITM